METSAQYRTRSTLFTDLCRASTPFAALFLFLLFSCGAKKAGEPANAKTSPGTPGIAPEHYVDTSQYPMHVTFTGWSGDTAKALNNLRGQLDHILSGPEFRNVVTSVKVVFFDPNNATHDIYSRDPNASVLPASTEKLFTSSSTIWALGSHYAFTTKLDLAPNASIQGSKIVGNVYLRPSGDPTLRSTDLDLLATQLRNKGITSIEGDIISDLGGEDALSAQAKSYMDAHSATVQAGNNGESHDSMVGDNGVVTSQDTSSSSDDDEISEAGVLSSFPNFALDRNVVAVTVRGGSGKGAPVSVDVFPPLSNVVVQNSGTTGAGPVAHSRTVGKGKHKRTVTTYSRTAMTLRVSSSGGPMDPQQIVSITGAIPARQQRTFSFPIKNVPMAMAAVLKWKLQQGGVQVTGQPRVDRSPANTVLKTVAVKQTNLIDLLTQMNKRSDNYLAESMFRKLSSIATVAANAPDERARTLMRSWLQVCNVDGSSCTFIDGSGLSKSNRTSANTVISLLTAIRQQGWFELFTHTLSVAGYDGTLRHRMIGTPAQYNAHGKTGTLNSVTALAGYVTTGDGQLAAYFITMQKFRGGPWTFKKDQDRIVATLASFKYSDFQSAATMPVIGDMGQVDSSGDND